MQQSHPSMRSAVDWFVPELLSPTPHDVKNMWFPDYTVNMGNIGNQDPWFDNPTLTRDNDTDDIDEDGDNNDDDNKDDD